jgi:hypothetical protein
MDWGFLWAGGGAASAFIVKTLIDFRKLKIDNRAADIDSDVKAVELFERYAKQITIQIEMLQKENTDLRAENNLLHEKISQMSIEISRLKSRIPE